MFGAYLIEELAMPAAIIPILPAAFSAWGMLMVDLRHDLVQTIACRLDALGAKELASAFAALEQKGADLLTGKASLPSIEASIAARTCATSARSTRSRSH